MADGSRVEETLETVVIGLMEEHLSFNTLRARVLEWITAKGDQLLSVDRTGEVILVDFYSTTGERFQVSVPETPEYTTGVRVSTW